jgi:hypothetical protein
LKKHKLFTGEQLQNLPLEEGTALFKKAKGQSKGV